MSILRIMIKKNDLNGHVTNTSFIGVAVVSSVSIRELAVEPSSLVEAGDVSEVVLDCDFDLVEDERVGLEVKWFFRMKPKPFLQWIPGQDRKPQVSEIHSLSVRVIFL